MNKKAKTNKVLLFVIIAAIAIALFFLMGYKAEVKTLKEIGEPADITKEEQGKGMDITFYKKVDGEWVPMTTPDWFTAGARTGPFAIVEHPPAPTCTLATV